MTAVSEDKLRDFYEGRRTETLPFVINDSVLVVEGPASGKTGAVISPDLESEKLVYLVELQDGSETQVAVSGLKLIS